jgi:Ca-activated chloride channel family protein
LPALLAVALLTCVSAQVRAQSSPPPPPPPSSSGAPQGQQGYTLKKDVDLVVLHATVEDAKGAFVPDLKEQNFKVFENKSEQKISVFRREDVPVTLGLVVDNSGSMREKRAQVNAAALTFVKTSNPQDEVFVVNFNDEFYLDLDKDFTNDPKELQGANRFTGQHGALRRGDRIAGSFEEGAQGQESPAGDHRRRR